MGKEIWSHLWGLDFPPFTLGNQKIENMLQLPSGFLKSFSIRNTKVKSPPDSVSKAPSSNVEEEETTMSPFQEQPGVKLMGKVIPCVCGFKTWCKFTCRNKNHSHSKATSEEVWGLQLRAISHLKRPIQWTTGKPDSRHPLSCNTCYNLGWAFTW